MSSIQNDPEVEAINDNDYTPSKAGEEPAAPEEN
jgi:hypothetical protein